MVAEGEKRIRIVKPGRSLIERTIGRSELAGALLAATDELALVLAELSRLFAITMGKILLPTSRVQKVLALERALAWKQGGKQRNERAKK